MDPSPAYILHRYPYRENGFLLKVFTQNEGLVTVVARHAKRPKSDWYALLQPFRKLALAYQGKGSVLTLTGAERLENLTPLQGKALFAGFYLNELLLKFLAPYDVHDNVFNAYAQTLVQLEYKLEIALRKFELFLFQDMGLLPDMTQDEHGRDFEDQAWYLLMPDQQPKLIETPTAFLPCHFQGSELKALALRDFTHPNVLKAAKRFSRVWLEFYGMGKELKSREVFAEVFTE